MLKMAVKHNTKANYKFVQNVLAREPFGNKHIDAVRLSDAKLFLIKLQREDGRGYSSIHTIRGVLRPAFQMAVDDDLLMKNPFEFQLGTVIVNDSVKREAVTTEQKNNFLEFVKQDAHYCRYYDAFSLLFATGMRISEFCGLTVKDLDFENGRIVINKQLQRTRNMEYAIETTKTPSGTRELPRYNREHKIMIPRITPHICRHSYCSEMAKTGMNPKTLQYLMGHSEISVTLNMYTHLGFDDAKEEIEGLFASNQ